MPDDLAIIGGGVAGLTAAIAARQAGLEVTLFERQLEPGDQPGETLHPGVEPLFEKLGVAADVAKHSPVRHTGIVTVRAGKRIWAPYGMTDGIPWRGFQIERRNLRTILLQRAIDLGARIISGCGRLELESATASGVVLRENGHKLTASWLIDATGPSNWLKRFDRVSYRPATPPMMVCYGYETSGAVITDNSWPELAYGPGSWKWTAPLGDSRLAWVVGSCSKAALGALRSRATGTADATWQVSKCPAHTGLFRVGDAAFRMDPSTGKGVLRAMMSSMMAVHLIGVRNELATEQMTADRAYCNWISHWFWSDFNEMKKLGLISSLEQAEPTKSHLRCHPLAISTRRHQNS